MKKLFAALLASTCIAGTAYAQEIPFGMADHGYGYSSIENGLPAEGAITCYVPPIVRGAITFLKPLNGKDFFVGGHCMLLPDGTTDNNNGQVLYDHGYMWIYGIAGAGSVFTADMFRVDCVTKTTTRTFTSTGTNTATINASAVAVIGGAAVPFGTQPKSLAAKMLCSSFLN